MPIDFMRPACHPPKLQVTGTDCQQAKLEDLHDSLPGVTVRSSSSNSSFHSSCESTDGRCIEKRNSGPPQGTFPYTVKSTDKLTTIAAMYDTTPSILKKTNRLTAEFLYPGQVVYIPVTSEEIAGHLQDSSALLLPESTGKVRGSSCSMTSVSSEIKPDEQNQPTSDTFIKMYSHYITDGHGVVDGTLLITPNAVMFDPNVSNPLVIEKGAEEFGVIVKMDTIMCAAIFHDIEAMQSLHRRKTDPSVKKPELFHFNESENGEVACDLADRQADPGFTSLPVKTDSSVFCRAQVNTDKQSSVPLELEPCTFTLDDVEVQDIKIEKQASPVPFQINIDSIPTSSLVKSEARTGSSVTFLLGSENEDENDDESDNRAQALPIKIMNANSIATSTSGNVDARYDSAYSLYPICSVPDDVDVYVDYSSGLFAKPYKDVESPSTCLNVGVKSDNAFRRDNSRDSAGTERSSSSFDSLPEARSISIGSTSKASSVLSRSTLVTKADSAGKSSSHVSLELEGVVKKCDKPELFLSIEDILPQHIPGDFHHHPDRSLARPLYLCVTIGKPINKSISSTCPIESYNKKRHPEYWFSIPRKKAGQLYEFFTRWKPGIYGDVDVDPQAKGFTSLSEDMVQSDVTVQSLALDTKRNGNGHVRRTQSEWEIVTMDELRSRLSMFDIEKYCALPQLCSESSILDELLLRELSKVLPVKVEGYPLSLVYSTDLHGFSLHKLYRNMHRFDSPVLLVIRAVGGQVFGALLSHTIHLSDAFYGTGETFVFSIVNGFKTYHWSRMNHFFVRCCRSGLFVGGGQGKSAIWLDEDIHHGRTQRCDTFDNEPLTGDAGDFIVQTVEAWSFFDDD